MKFLIQIIASIFATTSLLLAQELNKSFNLKVGTNFRIFPSTFSQTEVFIVRHPTNDNILFSSANTWNPSDFFISEGVYVTTDGGQSWFGSDTCKGEPINFHNGDPGITIDKNGRFILTRLTSILGGGLFSHYSDDLGQSWSFQENIVSDDIVERANVASDTILMSNFFGRTYATWVKAEGQFPPVIFSFTDDGGVNWSPTAQINTPSQRGAGADIEIGPSGVIYICWSGIISVSPFTEDFVGFALSTNGGASWTKLENAFDMNGINGLLTTKGNIRVNGLPRISVDLSSGPRHGWIYIITTQKNLSPAGSDPDVILNRSTDGGLTWSSRIRVNQDPLDNGKIQYFPAIHVDEFGGVNVLFYDDRNTTSDSTGVFLARSDDGGNSWREFEISDHNFKPVPLAGLPQGYQGDNIDITSANEKLYPVWMDNSTGNYQIWSTLIEIASVGVNEPSNQGLTGFELNQNYPNPFNPSTKISFKLSKPGFASLKIFNVLGKEVVKLFEEELESGEHQFNLNLSDLDHLGTLSSGIYFYSLYFHGKVQTKSMVLLK
jgi:hypothetical protein